MREQQINRISFRIMVVLSFLALFAVFSGYAQPPQPDEGAAAHILQLSIVAPDADDLAFLRNGGLETPFAKRASIGISSRSCSSRVCSVVLPGTLSIKSQSADQAGNLAKKLPAPGKRFCL